MTEDITEQLSLAARTTDPAPRVDTQSEDQPTYRPPFIIALLFTPFNLVYRLLVRRNGSAKPVHELGWCGESGNAANYRHRGRGHVRGVHNHRCKWKLGDAQ